MFNMCNCGCGDILWLMLLICCCGGDREPCGRDCGCGRGCDFCDIILLYMLLNNCCGNNNCCK